MPSGDLNTVFVAYVETLRDASAQTVLDSNTEVALDLADIYAASANDDDLNTAYAEVLLA